MAQRPLRALALGRVLLRGERALQRELEPAAQLRRRLAREGDGRHLLHLVVALQHALGHALGQALGLAGACARFHEQVDVQARADKVAGRPVGHCARLTHVRSASGRHRAPRCRRFVCSPCLSIWDMP